MIFTNIILTHLEELIQCFSLQGCKLHDLMQHTTYIVRCKAVNPLGESNWSEQISVTTQVIILCLYNIKIENLFF